MELSPSLWTTFRSFLQASAIRDRNANHLDWWNRSAGLIPNVAKLARDVLGVQAFSVAR